MQKFLEDKREEIAELCRTHHVKRLAVFGSAVRDDFDPEHSDVDFLVEFDSDGARRISYSANFFDLEEQLARLLRRDIDLITDGTIRNPYRLESIHRDRVQVYAA